MRQTKSKVIIPLAAKSEMLGMLYIYLETRSHNKNSPPMFVEVVGPVKFPDLGFMSYIFLKTRNNSQQAISPICKSNEYTNYVNHQKPWLRRISNNNLHQVIAYI